MRMFPLADDIHRDPDAFAWGRRRQQRAPARPSSPTSRPPQTRVRTNPANLLLARGDNVEISAMPTASSPTMATHLKTDANASRISRWPASRRRGPPSGKLSRSSSKQARSEGHRGDFRSGRSQGLRRLRRHHRKRPGTLRITTVRLTLDGPIRNLSKVNVMPRPRHTQGRAKQIYPSLNRRSSEPRNLGD